ncbi:MAG: flagellar biosynthesis protein FlhA [Hyphomicrobiaceae bacterium]
MADALSPPVVNINKGNRDLGFAVGIVLILTILFLPLPPVLVDIALAMSIALSVLILMVALWIQRPLEFSSFPTILLIATMLRLALNVATTRLILSEGANGETAAGHVISGFATFLMSSDFVIGFVIFMILVTVNFLVITKGATRIAEVGARFTLDAIPGKQMAIDADLSAGLINEKEAQRRRAELEDESSFFGAMDGASKFVRGDAIAGLIITAINVLGGIIIGVARHDMSVADAASVFTRLSVGDGLVSQIPALIISLAAGLLVSKASTRSSAEQAIFDQLGNFPRAIFIVSVLMFVFAVLPGLPFLPFAILGGVLAWFAWTLPIRRAKIEAERVEDARKAEESKAEESANSIKESLRAPEIEICLGKQLYTQFLPLQGELTHRVGRMRRRFAEQFGFILPEIKLTNDLTIEPKVYHLKVHGSVVAKQELVAGCVMVIAGDGELPSIPGDVTKEPAFGMKAVWIPEAFTEEVSREGFTPVDHQSILLTHLSETLKNNLAQLLSYRDMRHLLDGLEPEYKRLVDEITPAHISQSGLQAVMKLLLAERVSLRNLHLILEAIAEIAPHVRRTEQIAEHVRIRMSHQICGDLAADGTLSVLRLGNRWELVMHESLKRDGNGEIVEFDIDPALLEEFTDEATKSIRGLMDAGEHFVLVTSPDARPYIRMIMERIFTTLPVLSHVEIARGINVKSLGSIS